MDQLKLKCVELAIGAGAKADNLIEVAKKIEEYASESGNRIFGGINGPMRPVPPAQVELI